MKSSPRQHSDTQAVVLHIMRGLAGSIHISLRCRMSDRDWLRDCRQVTSAAPVVGLRGSSGRGADAKVATAAAVEALASAALITGTPAAVPAGDACACAP